MFFLKISQSSLSEFIEQDDAKFEMVLSVVFELIQRVPHKFMDHFDIFEGRIQLDVLE